MQKKKKSCPPIIKVVAYSSNNRISCYIFLQLCNLIIPNTYIIFFFIIVVVSLLHQINLSSNLLHFFKMGRGFVQTASDKISSEVGLIPSDLHQNSYRHLDLRSHLNLLSFKYICTNLNANRTFKLDSKLCPKPNPLEDIYILTNSQLHFSIYINLEFYHRKGYNN